MKGAEGRKFVSIPSVFLTRGFFTSKRQFVETIHRQGAKHAILEG